MIDTNQEGIHVIKPRRPTNPTPPAKYPPKQHKPRPDPPPPPPSAEIAPGLTVQYQPAHTELNEAGDPDPLGVGHFHLVEFRGEIEAGEPVSLQFRLDDRDGPIPEMASLKVRRASLDLANVADMLEEIGPGSYVWKPKPDKKANAGQG